MFFALCKSALLWLPNREVLYLNLRPTGRFICLILILLTYCSPYLYAAGDNNAVIPAKCSSIHNRDDFDVQPILSFRKVSGNL